MLNTETNTPAMERRVLRAGHFAFGRFARLQADFEHGQWWLTDLRGGARWSVCDASGPNSFQGFCFEQVSRGHE